MIYEIDSLLRKGRGEIYDAYGKRTSKNIGKYLFNNSVKEMDYLKKNYYKNSPKQKFSEEEFCYPLIGVGFNNVSSDYQNSLKIYRIRKR